MMRFATVIDEAYLPRLLVLWESMAKHVSQPFILRVLCWDPESYRILKTAGIGYRGSFIMPSTLESMDLLEMQGPPRTEVEQMWTRRAQFTAEVVRADGPAVQLDADQMFFGDPSEAIDFMVTARARSAVVPHWFAPESRGLPGPTKESHSRFGAFNAGFVFFSDWTIADWWARRCAEWCYHRTEDKGGRIYYADQTYLEDFEERGAPVFAEPVNVGPWCIHTQEIEVWKEVQQFFTGAEQEGEPFVVFGGRPLISYHYHSFDPATGRAANPEYAITAKQDALIYEPYRKALKEADRQLEDMRRPRNPYSLKG